MELIYPQIYTALRLLTVAPVSVISVERTFSKLMLIKNYLGSTTNEDRIVNVKYSTQIADKFSFENVISDFVAMMARKSF